MNKVEVTIHGQRALVDEDQVKKVLKKDALVNKAMLLQKQCSVTDTFAPANVELRKTTAQIIRLNRTIRQNVQFIKD